MEDAYPASVNEKLRVVRKSSFVPSRASSAPTIRATEGCDTCSSRAARERLPLSATQMARAAPEALETGGALYVAVVQGSASVGAWLGGIVVDDLGVANAMAASGIVALAAALLVPLLGRLSSRPGE